MRRVLFVLLVLINTICQAQSIFGVNISTPDGSNDKWGWDNKIGTYANRYSKDQPPFDVVYKFPGKGYTFTTLTGMYQDMPERFNQAYYTIIEKLGNPVAHFTNIEGYVHDTTDWSDLATPILTQGGTLEYYWYKNNKNTIRCILTWSEKGITLETKYFPLMSKADQQKAALNLKAESSAGNPTIKALLKSPLTVSLHSYEYDPNTPWNTSITYRVHNATDESLNGFNILVKLSINDLDEESFLRTQKIVPPHQSLLITIPKVLNIAKPLYESKMSIEELQKAIKFSVKTNN